MTVNLCFHGIGVCANEREDGEARYWVTRDTFLRVLDEVRGDSKVRLSFDDGNRSDIEIALPALHERGLTATFFALAGRLDDPASLDAAELRTLRANGMTIGSHGWQHVPWRRLSADEARREFVDARVALREASGAEIDRVALPLGRYDRGTLSGLRRAGYARVFTSDRLPARENAWLQPRYSLAAVDDLAAVKWMLSHRPGVADVRNRLATRVKRLR